MKYHFQVTDTGTFNRNTYSNGYEEPDLATPDIPKEQLENQKKMVI